jgi:hypothetical protein
MTASRISTMAYIVSLFFMLLGAAEGGPQYIQQGFDYLG